ncbi:MAG: Clp protease N-terminal domain-containing protein [Acidobacteriota bacterium]
MTIAGHRFSARVATANVAADVLGRWGVDYRKIVLIATHHGVATAPRDDSPPWRTGKSDPPVGRDFTASLQSARGDAIRNGRRWVGSSDVLKGLISDSAGSAVRLLNECGVNLTKMQAELEGLSGSSD